MVKAFSPLARVVDALTKYNVEGVFRKDIAMLERMFRILEHDITPHWRMRGYDRLDLMWQLVFMNFIVDAAWGDSEEACGLRLIALRLAQRGFEQ
jgi:hypothetical protein